MAMLDFDDEARKLWEEQGLAEGGVGDGHNAMDLMWSSPEGGGVFVGGTEAANDLKMLQQNNVTQVVNCTTSIRDFFPADLQYFTFDASLCSRPMSHNSTAKCAKFLYPLLQFVDRALQQGQSVLVHCRAGAHRAGTTGVILLMHYGHLSSEAALHWAQKRRKIISPIGSFPQLLRAMERFPRGPDGGFQLEGGQRPGVVSQPTVSEERNTSSDVSARDVSEVLEDDLEKVKDSTTFAEGDRVRTDKKHVGIVRFTGTVQGTTGQWVGVELDKPVGRNDGHAKGVRYFQCKHPHGLFLRHSSLCLF